MKKKIVKLVLHRETLRALTDAEQEKLQQVNGGFTVLTCFGLSCNICPPK